MEYGCRNKVVVISGGTSGIGLAAARTFWRDGAIVSIVGRDSAKGMKALAAIAGCKDPEAAVFPGLPEGTDTLSAAEGLAGDGSGTRDSSVPGTTEELARLRYIRADVTKPADCRMAAAIAAYYGKDRIDILVNSAGIYQEKRIENVTVADYNRIMDVNVKGTLLMIQACQPYMLPHGETEPGTVQDRCIINIASDAGIGGNYGCPVYCASKGAVVSLTKAQLHLPGGRGYPPADSPAGGGKGKLHERRNGGRLPAGPYCGRGRSGPCDLQHGVPGQFLHDGSRRSRGRRADRDRIKERDLRCFEKSPDGLRIFCRIRCVYDRAGLEG